MNGSKSLISFSTFSRLRSARASGVFFSGSGDMIALNGFHDRFLRRRRHAVVTLFGNGNRVETQPQPVFQSFLRAIVLAMRQRRQFDRTAHVARIGHGCRQLINGVMPPLHDRRRNQRHTAANRIHRDNIQPLSLVGRQLAEGSSQQIRQAPPKC